MLNAGAGARGLSTITTRAILDSIATRLDEGRELSRYLVGLLVFLGLLGTFWGLLETVHSIAGVIDSMKTGRRHGDHVRRPQARPVHADRRHERVVHLVAVRPRELADPRFPRPPGRPGAEPLLFRVRGVSRQPRPDDAGRRGDAGGADHPPRRAARDRISARRRRRSRRSPKESRLWSAICAPSSSKFATGSTRRPRSRKISASSCAACWTNWARGEART